MSSLKSIAILVTGANQGIGHSIVKQLLNEVNNVVIYAAARNQVKAEEAAKILNQSSKCNDSNKVIPIVIDLENDETIAKAAQDIPQLQVLINNAASSNLVNHTFDADASDLNSLKKQRDMFHTIFDTNVFGAVAVINAFLPHLRQAAKQDFNRSIRPTIINVSSGAGSINKFAASPTVQPTPLSRPSHYYAASKSVLNVYTLFYSKLVPELRVVSVSPGFTKTFLNNFTGTHSTDDGARYITDVVLDKNIGTGIFLSSGQQHDW